MAQFNDSQMATLAKQFFKANAIVLPERFSGFGPQAPFTASDQTVPDPAALFQAASTLNYHVDTQKAISKHVEDLIDAVCKGVGAAFRTWQASAKFVNVLINGPLGMGPPSCLVGPPMSGPVLMAQVNVAGRQPTFIRYVQSITGALGMGLTAWQLGFMVQLPYPSGAVQSVTMVPAPNVPVPLAAGSSPGDAMLQAGTLKGMMVALHGPLGNHALQIFDAMAQAFAITFTTWKATTMIQQVMGAGGVAPPPPSPPGPVAMAIGVGGMLQ